MDWAEACRILGISEFATEAQIKEQYLYKAQLLHPDKNQDKPEAVRKKAEAEFALVNQAYNHVNNPLNNPYRIPPKLAIDPLGVRFKNVKLGEKKTTTLIIANSGGPYTSIWLDNNPAPWLMVAGIKSLTTERLPLEVTLECTGSGEPDKLYTCDLLIKLENENTHSVDQVTIRIELYTVSEVLDPVNGKENPPAFQDNNDKLAGNKPAANPAPVHKMGFSTLAFLVNLLGFAAVGAVLVVLVMNFTELTLESTELKIIIIAYFLISFGFSFNQGISIGSKRKKPG